MFVFRVTLLLAFGLLLADPARAADQAAPQQCWSPQALSGTQPELARTRAKHPFDPSPLKAVQLQPASPIPPALRGSIRSVALPAGEKLITLTFDLCETEDEISGYEGRIVDLLRAQGVKATFFAGGKWMETHPERAEQLIADPLFEVGSHGLTHLDLSRVKPEKLNEEIVLTEAAFARAKERLTAKQCALPERGAASALPVRMAVMRFPYGRCDAKSLAAVADQGLLAIQWDIVTGDPDPREGARAIANRILTRAHPGAIVVAHANGRGWHTAEALQLAIPKLKEQGYQFVTVSELVAAGKPVIASTCYENTPGDEKGYAHVSAKRGSHDLHSIFDGLY
jgi:peptidoglycan/xylan/chitin deacetylase (PgdA/CDA1 family)